MMKKTLACLLAVLQLALLIPMTAQAADKAETPVLNETIVDTMQFGTYSFGSGGTAPDGQTPWDGGDYVKPFFYSDDYFAAPSYDSAPAAKELTWRELPNAALAAASADLTFAAAGTNEVLWSDFSRYSKNAEAYLTKCGFTDFAVNAVEDPAAEDMYNRFPSKDSIGVVLGKKQITVWNGSENETCTLIAIGVRGGGYYGEWASNLTIGQSGRHLGFAQSEEKVLKTLREYLQATGVTAADHVKYWIAGFSRGGAVANLAAGDICSAPETYFAAKQDVYCYTFECPRGAVDTEDPDGTVFPNIHNILNRMDPVPRVSPAAFGNDRLGVDYYIPDHTNNDRMDDYYMRMYRVLEALAPGYGSDVDIVVKNSDPALYPYNRPVEIYNFSLQALISDFNSMGLEPYRDWRGLPIGTKDGAGYSLYLDEFLDRFVNAFICSRAWDYDPAAPTAAIKATDPLTHRQHYGDPERGIEEGIRTFLGAAVSKPGASIGDAFSGIGSAIPSIILPVADLLVKLKAGYDLVPTESNAQSIAKDVESILKSILLQSDSFKPYEADVIAAAKALSPVLTRLFLYDRMNTGSQYLGTLLKYTGDQIITPHIAEQGVSWTESLDEDYVGGYRSLTVPKAADVKLVQFREGLDDALSAFGEGVLMAEAQDGEFVQRLDQRVTVAVDGEMQTVCFPAFLDVRAEITLPDGTSTDKLPLYLDGLQPADGRTSWRADYERDPASGNILPDTVRYHTFLTSAAEPGMEQINNADIALADGETLLLCCGRSTSDFESPVQGSFEIARRGGNAVTNGTDRNDRAVLASRLFEEENGDYTLTVTVRALQDLAGKTLTAALNGKDFDLSNVVCTVNGEAASIRNDTVYADAALRAGETLTVQVTGLIPVGSGTLCAAQARFDGLQAQSETVVETRTTLLRYGADAVAATGVQRLAGADASFSLEGDVLTYHFADVTLRGNNTSRERAAMLMLSGIDGVNIFRAGRWVRQTVAPADSIFFDDSFRNPAIPGEPGDPVFSLDTEQMDAVDPASGWGVTRDFFFRFQGSRIDLCCTADANTGYVSAGVFDENGNLVDSVIVTSRSQTTKYSEPTVSFSGLDPSRTYTLQLKAIAGANYRLDGIRVYSGAAGAAEPGPDGGTSGGSQALTLQELLNQLLNSVFGGVAKLFAK